jgi:hypothetical protein
LVYVDTDVVSFVGVSLVIEYSGESVEEVGEGLGGEVGAGGVLVGEVVGLFPLVDVVFGVGVVGGGVVVEDAFSDLEIAEPDATFQASEVGDGGVVGAEEIEDLGGVGVVVGQHFLLGGRGVVGAVAHGAGVVVGVEFVEEHL